MNIRPWSTDFPFCVQVCEPDIMDSLWHHCHTAGGGQHSGKCCSQPSFTSHDMRFASRIHTDVVVPLELLSVQLFVLSAFVKRVPAPATD